MQFSYRKSGSRRCCVPNCYIAALLYEKCNLSVVTDNYYNNGNDSYSATAMHYCRFQTQLKYVRYLS